MSTWHLITGEYPPRVGGVSHYSQQVARGLAAAGDEVHVWTPACPVADERDPSVEVHRLPGHFGARTLAGLRRSIDNCGKGRLLVQYVPHAFGLKAMNMPFCIWLYGRRREGGIVMFHEVAFPMRLRQPLRHNLLGAVNRLMALMVARSAEVIFVASIAWERQLRRCAGQRPVRWLPVPSNIPVIDDPAGIAEQRRRYVPNGGSLIGHFGTYARPIAELLDAVLPKVLENTRAAAVLLMGSNSVEYRARLVRDYPLFANRIHATGEVGAVELSLALAGCDVMVQPYPDGVSTKRGSVMAALAHGRAIVTTGGVATEPLWEESGAVSLEPANNIIAVCMEVRQLVERADRRERRGRAALELYAQRFDLSHTISALRMVMNQRTKL